MNSIKIPGRRLILPSRGLLYTLGNELNSELVDGEVTIVPFTMRDEMMLSSPDMILSGDAINHVIKKCVKEVKEPTQLFFNDVIAILTYLKMVTYGNSFPIKFGHSCTAEQIEVKIDLDEFIKTNIKFYDATLKDMLDIKYDDCHIKLDFPRYASQIKLIQESKNIIENGNSDSRYDFMIDLIANGIASINFTDGNIYNNKKEIKTQIEELPASIASDIYENINKTNELFGVISTYNIKCPVCGEILTIDLPLDPTLFF